MTPKLLFLDWDGTLCFDLFWRSLTSKNERVREAVNFLFSEEKDLVDDWMRGGFSSEEINARISEKSGCSFDELWNSFVYDCQTMNFDARLREKLSKIRQTSKIVLITGNMDCFKRFTIPALKLDDCFDDMVISCKVGYLKNEKGGQQFIDMVNKFEIELSDTVLIDDSDKVLKVFAELGGVAVKTTGLNKTLEILNSLLK
ncbi:MAG: hypothetical protein V1716_05345 [Candidatus Uhrbacteria bacterium]